MKIGPVTKLDKKNKTTSKKKKKKKENDDDFMSKNCDITAIFPIHGQFGAICKPRSRCLVCKTYIFINSNVLSYKN